MNAATENLPVPVMGGSPTHLPPCLPAERRVAKPGEPLLTGDMWDRTIDTHFKGTFFRVHAATPTLVHTRGCGVTASDPGLLGFAADGPSTARRRVES